MSNGQIDEKAWRDEIGFLASRVAEYFKPKENLLIQDFIATVYDWLRDTNAQPELEPEE